MQSGTRLRSTVSSKFGAAFVRTVKLPPIHKKKGNEKCNRLQLEGATGNIVGDQTSYICKRWERPTFP